MQISVTNALELLLMLAIPLLVFAWIIHQIERLTQRRLAERFGKPPVPRRSMPVHWSDWLR